VAHGLGPLGDQQLAGALMWVPPMFVYLSAAAGLLLRWFRTLEPAVGREEVPA
jgi:cytochrome c oxidase assembly factor CtaG